MFEAKFSLIEQLIESGYTLKTPDVFHETNYVGKVIKKYDFYKYFLIPLGIDYKDFWSKKLLPDEGFFNEQNSTLFIIEKKFQKTPGSVDEKLQTCRFKLNQYRKIVPPDIKVDYSYVLNDWFRDPKYRDVLDFVHDEGCNYYFEEMPLTHFGLKL